MKQRFAALVLALSLIVLLASCKRAETNEDTTDASAALDAFFTEDPSEEENASHLTINFHAKQETAAANETTTEASLEDVLNALEGIPTVGAGLFLSPDDPNTFSPLIYEGGNFSFYYQVGAGTDPSEITIGFMLNGIYQPFQIERAGEPTGYDTWHTVTVPAGTSKIYKILMKPTIGSKGEILQFCSASITNPSALITEEGKAYATSDLCIMATLASPFTMNSDSDHSASVCTNFSGMAVNSYNSMIKKWFSGINNTGDLCQAVLYNDLDSTIYYERQSIFKELVASTRLDMPSATAAPLTISLGGGKYGTTQRVSVYVNNEILPVFDGQYYADVPIENNRQTDLSITLNTKNLNEWNNIYVLMYTLDDSPYTDSCAFTQSSRYVLHVDK